MIKIGLKIFSLSKKLFICLLLIFVGAVAECSLSINFSDFEDPAPAGLKNIEGDMVYQPKYFLKNLPKYESLGQNGIRRKPLIL